MENIIRKILREEINNSIKTYKDKDLYEKKLKQYELINKIYSDSLKIYEIAKKGVFNKIKMVRINDTTKSVDVHNPQYQKEFENILRKNNLYVTWKKYIYPLNDSSLTVSGTKLVGNWYTLFWMESPGQYFNFRIIDNQCTSLPDVKSLGWYTCLVKFNKPNIPKPVYQEPSPNKENVPTNNTVSPTPQPEKKDEWYFMPNGVRYKSYDDLIKDYPSLRDRETYKKAFRGKEPPIQTSKE